jgi:hypothetical protein
MRRTPSGSYVLALIGRKLLLIMGLEQLYPDRDRPGAIVSDRMLFWASAVTLVPGIGEVRKWLSEH